ncbi:MAG: response regulator [Chloroflexi bacterium]|nr:response regulator [Chloroflexota bacterium]
MSGLSSRTGNDTDLHISAQAVGVGVAISGLVLLAVSEFADRPDAMTGYSLLMLAAGATVGAVSEGRRIGFRWLTVGIVAAFTLLAGRWLDLTSALVLFAVPVSVAAVLIGPSAGALIALGASLPLLLPGASPFAAVSLTVKLLVLLATWGTLGLIYGLYRRLSELEGWLQEYFRQSQSLVEEARDRRAELGQAMETMTHLNRQLLLVNERSAALRMAAEDAERTKAAFVAKVSHELRTPLNMIIGLVGLMVEKPWSYGEGASGGVVPADLMEDLRIVYRNSQHLLSLINDVLDLSQVEAGRLTLYREPVNLAEVIHTAAEAVKPLIDKKGLSLDVYIPDDLPEVRCDRTRIRQVVLNLVSNAARFTEQGSISIRLGVQDGRITVQVRDTGPGVAPDVVERIFEPFYQADERVWHDKGGSGLGLSISRQFVRLHGGRIWLESEIGVGSTFAFDLPLVEPVASVSSPAGLIRPDWVWREQAFRTDQVDLLDEPVRPRVVVCDVSDDLVQDLASLDEQVEFVHVRSLEEAAVQVAECPVQLVLLNEPDSQQMTARFDQTRKTIHSAPVVGTSMPSRLARVHAAGSIGYLTKPVTQGQLEQAVRGILTPVRRVLVVDDNDEVLHLLDRMLRTMIADLEVHAVSSGRQAIRAMRETHYDLVLLDVIMPDLDGWGVLEQKGRDPMLREVPVILVSAQDPMDQPRVSDTFYATTGGGISVSQLLRCALGFSEAVSRRAAAPDPMPG